MVLDLVVKLTEVIAMTMAKQKVRLSLGDAHQRVPLLRLLVVHTWKRHASEAAVYVEGIQDPVLQQMKIGIAVGKMFVEAKKILDKGCAEVVGMESQCAEIRENRTEAAEVGVIRPLRPRHRQLSRLIGYRPLTED